MGLAFRWAMTLPLPILNQGSCEPFKAAVHGTALGLFALMGLYNAAAWINRRDRHLVINAVVYGTLVFWERRLVAHHVDRCRQDARSEDLFAGAPVTVLPESCESEGACDVPLELVIGNRPTNLPQVAA